MPFPDFSPLELRILEEIEALPDCEAHIFVKDGEDVVDMAIHPVTGGHLPPGVIARLNAGEEIRLIHNHPKGGSLSVSDLTVLSNFPTLQIFAVTPTGSIHGVRILDAIQIPKLQKHIPNLQTVEDTMQSMIDETSIFPLSMTDYDHFQRVVGIYRNQRLSEIDAFEFTCLPSSLDLCVTTSLYHTDLKKRWMKFLKQQYP